MIKCLRFDRGREYILDKFYRVLSEVWNQEIIFNN